MAEVRTATQDQTGGTVPPQGAVTNPPATLEQISQDQADRARAAVGGAGAAAAPETEPAAADAPQPELTASSGVWSAQKFAEHGGPTHASRFDPPPMVDFEFTPPATQQVRNSNVPLTIGLLFSIVASFIVFFVSMAGGASGSDPIMPAFWRALGALAVLVTLSFAASWFMPAPQDRRKLLEQLDAEDRALKRYRDHSQQPPAQPQRMSETALHLDFDSALMPEPDAEADMGFDADMGLDPDKGSSIDFTLDDDEEDLLAAPLGDAFDDDDFDDEEDLLATTPNKHAPFADSAGLGA